MCSSQYRKPEAPRPTTDRVTPRSGIIIRLIAKMNMELKEMRRQMLPTATTFSPRDSQSNLSSSNSDATRQSRSKLHFALAAPSLSSPLGLPKEFFLLLRQYEEEMLDAFLQDDDYFSELLHSQDLRNERSKIESCNIQYELLPTILGASHLRSEKDARKLAAIALFAAGYAGDMPEDLANELLDDIDYHFNKVKCRKIELLMPKLMKMVESEMEGMR